MSNLLKWLENTMYPEDRVVTREVTKELHHWAFIVKKGVPKIYLDGELFDGSYDFWKRGNIPSDKETI